MEWWNNFCLWCKDFFSQPVPIIGVSVGLVLAYTLIVLAKTSIGKKSLNKLTALHNEANNKLNDAQIKANEYVEEFKEFKNAKIREIAELKNNYEIKLEAIRQENKRLETLLVNVCNNIHNNNIKSLIDTYINEINEEIVISDVVEVAKEEARSEFENKLAELESRLNAYEEREDN